MVILEEVILQICEQVLRCYLFNCWKQW